MEKDKNNKNCGGSVKKSGIQKFAMGGAAKVRLGVATQDGSPKNLKKSLTKRNTKS